MAMTMQALHLFKKAELLLESLNKELDKSRVMSNRPPRGGPLQRTSSISPLSADRGMPQTPGPTQVPVSRVRHARCVLLATDPPVNHWFDNDKLV